MQGCKVLPHYEASNTIMNMNKRNGKQNYANLRSGIKGVSRPAKRNVPRPLTYGFPAGKQRPLQRPLPPIPKNEGKKTRLSECAQMYLQALEDPFNAMSEACIPLLPSTPSRKLKVWNKGVLTVGTAGFGFVQALPCADNNTNCIWISTATYTGTITALTGTGVSSQVTNSDYTSSQFALGYAGLSCRIVGFGIRVMYTGSLLNLSGDVHVLEEPNHGSLNGLSVANFDAYDKSQKFSTSKMWTNVTYHPVLPTDTDYAGNSIPLGAGNVPILGIAISSLAGNTFDYEVYGIFEVIGSIARGKSPSMNDTVGVDAVLNVVQSRPRDGYVGAAPIRKELTMADHIVSGLSSLATIIPSIMEGVAMFA